MKNTDMIQKIFRTAICLLLFVSTSFVMAQDNEDEETVTVKKPVKKSALPQYEMKEVKGVVLDEATKQPMGGVRVQALDNSYYSTLTEENGTYTIKVPVFVTALYVSAPDYNGVQVSIKKNNEVPTAYLDKDILPKLYNNGTSILDHRVATMPESSSTTVDGEIEKKLASSVYTVNRNGMPVQGSAMFINGINSLNINAQPLVVVDGVIWDMQYDRKALHTGFYNNILSLIDTEDIESVEVVNNGTALYGAQGANGVIVIKTKRGHSMATKINIRVYGGVEMKPELMSMMNANQYRNYVTEFLGTTKYAENLSGMSSNIAFMNPNSFYYPQYNNQTDWQKDLYRAAWTQNYRVNVQGGDDVAKYALALGYTKSDATIKENSFNRLNIRFNTDVNLFRNFDTELDMGFVRTAYDLLDNGWAESYFDRNISSVNVLGTIQSPFLSKYTWFTTFDDATGKLTLRETDKILGGKDYNSSSTTNPFLFAKQFGYEGLANPYWILSNGPGDNKNYQEQTQFFMNIAPRYAINRYLTISDRFSYILTRINERLYMPYTGTPDKEVEGLGTVNSILQSQFAKETTLFNDLRIEWKRVFAAHTIDLIGGFRFASYSYSNSTAKSYNNDNDKMPNMSYQQQYKENGGTNDTWRSLTYYLNADYNYKNRYFARFIVSAEASSRFGKDAKKGLKMCGVPWGIFPSLQFGWVMSNEEWFTTKAFDYVKLGAGWEMSGNDNVDYYAARTYFANQKFLDKLTGLELSNIENGAIQWETNYRWNLGLSLRTLHNRLGVDVNFFAGRTTDLINRKSVSDITGLGFMWANDGELKNKGVEVNLNGVLFTNKDWKWQAGASLGHFKNEITALADNKLNEVISYSLAADGSRDQKNVLRGYITNVYGANVLTMVGESAGIFYGYQTKGVFATDAEAKSAGKYGYLRYPTGLKEQPYRNFQAGDVHFVDQNGDGWINEADMVKIGDATPKLYGNFWTSLTWKDLTLDVCFKYSLGNDIFNYQRMQLESANNIWNQTTAVCNRWRAEGQQTDMPRTMCSTSDQWVDNERFSDRWVEDGSYLKLKNIRLTYRLPLNLSWLEGLKVWVEGNNLFTATKYLGQDPETSCSNSVLYRGIDTGMLNCNKNVNFGVTINL